MLKIGHGEAPKAVLLIKPSSVFLGYLFSNLNAMTGPTLHSNEYEPSGSGILPMGHFQLSNHPHPRLLHAVQNLDPIGTVPFRKRRKAALGSDLFHIETQPS